MKKLLMKITGNDRIPHLKKYETSMAKFCHTDGSL